MSRRTYPVQPAVCTAQATMATNIDSQHAPCQGVQKSAQGTNADIALLWMQPDNTGLTYRSHDRMSSGLWQAGKQASKPASQPASKQASQPASQKHAAAHRKVWTQPYSGHTSSKHLLRSHSLKSHTQVTQPQNTWDEAAYLQLLGQWQQGQ